MVDVVLSWIPAVFGTSKLWLPQFERVKTRSNCKTSSRSSQTMAIMGGASTLSFPLHWFILYSGFPGLCSPLNRLSYYVPRANVSIHTFIFSILTYSSDTNLEGLDN